MDGWSVVLDTLPSLCAIQHSLASTPCHSNTFWKVQKGAYYYYTQSRARCHKPSTLRWIRNNDVPLTKRACWPVRHPDLLSRLLEEYLVTIICIFVIHIFLMVNIFLTGQAYLPKITQAVRNKKITILLVKLKEQVVGNASKKQKRELFSWSFVRSVEIWCRLTKRILQLWNIVPLKYVNVVVQISKQCISEFLWQYFIEFLI